MALIDLYKQTREDEEKSRVRRVLTLRAMQAIGLSQRDIAHRLGVSQPAISQQLNVSPKEFSAKTLISAAKPVLKELADYLCLKNLSIFGSVAREEATENSDVDLIATMPEGTGIKDLIAAQKIFEKTLGRDVDLISRKALNPDRDADIISDEVRV